MNRAQRRKHYPRVAARVRSAKVIKIDTIFSAADRELILERPRWDELCVGSAELGHLLHIRFGVLVSDEFHVSLEEFVAAGVILMSVRVDDHCYRLLCHSLYFVQNRLPVARRLRVNENNAVFRNEHGGVTGAVVRCDDHIKVVLHLLNLERRRSLTLKSDGHHRKHAQRYENAQHYYSFHVYLPREKSIISTRGF